MKRLLEGRAECGENSAMASRFSPSNGFSLPFLLLLLIVLQLSTPRRGERAPWEQRDLVSHRQKKQIHMQPLSDEKKAKIPRCGFASSFGVFGALFGLLFPSSWWWRVLVLFARDGDKGQKEGARGVEGGGNSKRQGQRASERPRLRALRRRVWSRSFFFFFFFSRCVPRHRVAQILALLEREEAASHRKRERNRKEEGPQRPPPIFPPPPPCLCVENAPIVSSSSRACSLAHPSLAPPTA